MPVFYIIGETINSLGRGTCSVSLRNPSTEHSPWRTARGYNHVNVAIDRMDDVGGWESKS